MQKENILANIFAYTSCNCVLQLKDTIFKSYFDSKQHFCPNCKQKLDVWDLFIDKLNPPMIHFAAHYGLLGCIDGHETFTLKRNEETIIDLNNRIGDGILLYANFTPSTEMGEGVNFPFISSQMVYPINYFYKTNVIHITGFPNNKDVKENYLNVNFWYAPKEIKENLSTMLLLNAFKFFFEENYHYMIISAHTSIEILFNKFFKSLFSYTLTENNKLSRRKEKKINNFFKDGATYGFQLYPLFPLICEIEGYDKLNDKILEGLKNLKDDRNNLIHTGVTDFSDKSKMKSELIAAFFAFKYFNLIHDIF